MATSRCEACGREEYMPFVCKFCKKKFCVEHRLPENHRCGGLEEYRQRARAEGRLLAPDPEAIPMRPTMVRGSALRANLSRAFSRIDGRMAWVFLGVMLATFVAQLLVLHGMQDPRLHNRLFVMDPGFILKPWVLVSAIFAHDPLGFSHLLFNGITLAFAGPVVERLLGTKRFVGLFLAAGLLGGLGQVLLGAALGSGGGVLGASGAIMGLLGTLVVLAPRMTVAFMGIFPAPLWVLIVLYALFDLYGAFGGAFGGGIAHLAHLSGLGAGLLYGKHLRDRGMRAVTRPTMPPRRW